LPSLALEELTCRNRIRLGQDAGFDALLEPTQLVLCLGHGLGPQELLYGLRHDAGDAAGFDLDVDLCSAIAGRVHEPQVRPGAIDPVMALLEISPEVLNLGAGTQDCDGSSGTHRRSLS
jgi:hypothetical protein